MKMNYIKADSSKMITWASGTSTELFIYPSSGNFQTREFLFRISTATVDAEESVFSDFSGITRTLMVLEGNLTLIHQGRYTKELKPFDQDTFDGGWDTKSKGKVKDFNLMYKEGAKGSLAHYSGTQGELIKIDLSGDLDFIYAENGSFKYDDITLSKGDTLFFERGNENECKITSVTQGDLIHVSVILNT